MRLLLVEDSDRLRRSLSDGLRRSGYAVDLAADGNDGLRLALETDYDVAILDIQLPGQDGLSVLAAMRDAGRATHVLLLTARDTVEDRVTGLRAGADDYLIKPFAFDELLARVEALTRRRHVQKSSRLTVGPLEIDPAMKTARVSGQPIDFTPREYALVEFLAFRRGQVVSRAEIEEHIYDMNAELMSNAVDSAVCAIRRKIDKAGEPSLIRTRRGAGYVLIESDA